MLCLVFKAPIIYIFYGSINHVIAKTYPVLINLLDEAMLIIWNTFRLNHMITLLLS